MSGSLHSSDAPVVSVVLSVHNGERHLAAALRSVSAQSYRNFELIVIDDGSTDGTAEILEAFRAAEPRAIVVHQENRGLTASLNRGVALARGAFIARQDADDVSLPERFARQVARLEAAASLAGVGCN